MRQRSLKRILLVEDDPDIQTVTSLALRGFGGFDVCICGSAQQAVESATEFRPDLILLDVMMPGMDGVEALLALRETPVTAEVPVVFLTARVQPHEVQRYRELGSLAVIPKPFEPTTLADTIRGIWEARGA
ncbi:MAG TPA: response regulator [Vicinamibacteria bacterium]